MVMLDALKYTSGVTSRCPTKCDNRQHFGPKGGGFLNIYCINPSDTASLSQSLYNNDKMTHCHYYAVQKISRKDDTFQVRPPHCVLNT